MHKQYNFICENCGKQFKRPLRNYRFCSRSCAGLTAHHATTPETFWDKVDKSGGVDACWPWTGGCNRDGYGVTRWTERRKAHTHRIAYELTHGQITPGLEILHRCDNPPCCNPAHLFEGTQAENVTDMMQKGRGNKSHGDDHWTRKYPQHVKRGEASPVAKLTWEQVREIRARYIPNVVSSTQLGREYGTTHRSVLLIVHNKIWVE